MVSGKPVPSGLLLPSLVLPRSPAVFVPLCEGKVSSSMFSLKKWGPSLLSRAVCVCFLFFSARLLFCHQIALGAVMLLIKLRCEVLKMQNSQASWPTPEA